MAVIPKDIMADLLFTLGSKWRLTMDCKGYNQMSVTITHIETDKQKEVWVPFDHFDSRFIGAVEHCIEELKKQQP
jgi:hypothetical protein